MATKVDVIQGIRDRVPGLHKADAAMAVDQIMEYLKSAILRGQRVEIRGVGVFVVKRKKTGVARNIEADKIVSIPDGMAVRFKPGKDLKGLQD